MANLMTDSQVAPRSVKTSVKHYTLQSESINGRIQTRSLGARRRSFTISYPPMTRDAFVLLYGFLNAVGREFSFEVYVPNWADTDTFNFLTGDGCEEVTVILANDVQEFDIGVNNLYEIEIDVVEVLQ